MADELDDALNQPDSVESRIKDLSKKVRLTSEERDEQKRNLEERDGQLADATKERDFYQGFSDVIGKHPNAKDYKDAILAKVKSGYSIEDATVSVLNQEGKLSAPPIERQSAAGGSATTTIANSGTKSNSEMNQAERRSALLEAEQRGDIGVN